jgi:hypothetical protein
MNCEIRFLNANGKLRCSLRAQFISRQAATRYARIVMSEETRDQFASAEICDADHPYPFQVLWKSGLIALNGSGAVRSNGKDGAAAI